MSSARDDYFSRLEAQVESAYSIAERARSRGDDPSPDVEIPIAKDMADRVQNLLGIPGVADRVRTLEAEMSREEAALALAEDFAAGNVGDAVDPAGKIEGAVRTAVALLTEGVVAAPIEGIDGAEIATNDDGSEFVRVYYAGPIRSAGGTAQALSVLVADYTRALLGIGSYQPRPDEIERYAEEVALYDDDTGLQYTPSSDESRFIASNCPICLDGEPTADVEVSGFRDLDRVETNRARGGMCLVLAEGIALKAPKIKRYTNALEEVSWPWLDDLMAGTIGSSDVSAADDQPASPPDEDGHQRVGGLPVPAPKAAYLNDLIAGRPVFAHPSRPGGFRLRYGRARNHGFATAGVHPATMHLLDDFLATGTQVKTERPGKAAGVVPVDSIEGPTVRLRTGEVRRVSDAEEAKAIRGGVETILDVGEYLVNVGEFVENNYPLAPASYAPEWWVQELEAADVDVGRLRDDPDIDLWSPTPDRAIAWAVEHDVPLHPRYTYLWHDLDAAAVVDLVDAVASAELIDDALVLTAMPDRCTALETLLMPHERTSSGIVVTTWRPFVRTLGFDVTADGPATPSTQPDVRDAGDGLAAVNALAPFPVRAKAPTRVGLRMGRPEKSEVRELSPAVHTLFPIGNAGGDQRNVSDASRHAESMTDRPGEVTVEVGQRRCPDCEETTFRFRCSRCHIPTDPHWECDECGITIPSPDESPPTCPRCDRDIRAATSMVVDLGEVYRDALDRVGERESAFPILKGVKGLMSTEMAPEPMAKGVLRAKHGVSTFKDGTIRYDMTDLPVTAVRPDELDVDVAQLRELGYDEDIHGEELTHGDQLVPLKVQDVVLSRGAAAHLVRTADFVDDLLESFYELEPFYEIEEPSELVGELVFGLAPHTSAAVVGRIIGFTDAAVGYAHPYFHAAKRRNCDGDEDCVMLLMDGLLNFSKSYLPRSRGGRMDAPLVMSTRIDPAEIDDEAHNMDIVDEYPLAFYEATLRMAQPDEVEIALAGGTVGTSAEYAPFGHTHDTTNIAAGPALSAYKTLESMMDKMDAQLALARKLHAVDESDVAERVIESHFLPDLLGNLRAFSSQSTRCPECGQKYRRPPLTGDCRMCGGNVSLTVHRGSVEKYMETAIEVAERFECPAYMVQRLKLLERNIASIFEDDQNKQSGIADFM